MKLLSCQIPFLKSKLTFELHDRRKHYKLINLCICLQLCKLRNRQASLTFLCSYFSFSFSIYCQAWAFELCSFLGRIMLFPCSSRRRGGGGSCQLPVPNYTASLVTSVCTNSLQRSYCLLSVQFNMSTVTHLPDPVCYRKA